MLRLRPDDPLVANHLTAAERKALAGAAAKKPKHDMELQIELALQARCLVFGLVTQYQFEPARKWRFDFAWPTHRFAVEFEGLVVTKNSAGYTQVGGRHASISGMKRDMEKYNAAAKLGWLVLRYEQSSVRDGTLFDDVEYMLGRGYGER